MKKKKHSSIVINDYSLLYEKGSEFLYQTFDHVEAYAMRKENFLSVMNQKYGKSCWKTIRNIYKYQVQEPVHEHREETAQKFQNRIDYVNIKAYDAGRIEVDNH